MDTDPEFPFMTLLIAIQYLLTVMIKNSDGILILHSEDQIVLNTMQDVLLVWKEIKKVLPYATWTTLTIIRKKQRLLKSNSCILFFWQGQIT